VRLSDGYSLIEPNEWGAHANAVKAVDPVNAAATASTVAAAVDVFGWHQVTDFNANFGFLCSHVI